MITPFNPFLLTGYVSPEYFCGRKNETKMLISALRNGRNVTLVSPRRMGKTGLIRHVFHQAKQRGGVCCYYVDLYQTDSLASLVRKLGEEVLGTLDTREMKIVRSVASFFRSLRPAITVDPVTGELKFAIDVQPQMAEQSLAEIFSYMQKSGKRCYVAFDEFQTVASYADKNVEALLRAHIQHLTSVQFIFSGSQRHVLENMFTSAARPFYQSAQMMHLGNIDKDVYRAFAEEKLKAHGQELTVEGFDDVYDLLAGHTWYIQVILNRLYESGEKLLTADYVERMMQNVVAENEATYHTFLTLVTPSQGKLLASVAKEGFVRELLSKQFIGQYGLGAVSTVRSAAKALIDKELLLQDERGYQVYDRFFSLWLSKSYV